MPRQPRDPNARLTAFQAAPQIETIEKRTRATIAKLTSRANRLTEQLDEVNEEIASVAAEAQDKVAAIRARVDDPDKMDRVLDAARMESGMVGDG